MCFFLKINFITDSSDYADEAEFTLTKSGSLKLIYDNYEFYKHSILLNGETFWRCEKYNVHKCKVKAYTRAVGLKEMVKVTGTHTHGPEN